MPESIDNADVGFVARLKMTSEQPELSNISARATHRTQQFVFKDLFQKNEASNQEGFFPLRPNQAIYAVT